jgi:hypothetical protein
MLSSFQGNRAVEGAPGQTLLRTPISTNKEKANASQLPPLSPNNLSSGFIDRNSFDGLAG